MLKKRYGKFGILLIVQLLAILALLPGCFRREELVDAFGGGDIPEPTAQAGEDVQFCGPGLTLGPGVYRIRIQTDLAEGRNMYVQMKCGLESFKALRNNGMVIFPGNDCADFEVYVLDKVETAYVQCDFHNVDASGLVRLEVWKTNLGNRMLLFVLAVCFGVWDFLAVFRRRILEGKVSVRQQVVFWTLAAGVLLTSFPLLTDYVISGYDSKFHWSRIAFLADSLKQGTPFPVRVEGEWLYGHGYASPLFYGNLFLYIPAFFRLLGFSVMTSYKMFLFLVMAVTAITAYHSMKVCVKDEFAALFGSMVYLLAPYRLYNIYGRGAAGEFLAQAFLPLVCCGMYLLYAKDTASAGYGKYKWYVVAGLSAILQSHLISTEMIAVSLAALCIFFWRKTFQKQRFFQLLSAAGIVLALNAWFWLPLLYMMYCDSYHMQGIIESVLTGGIPGVSLFQYLPGTEDVQTGRSTAVGAGATLLLLFYMFWHKGKKNRNRICDFLAVCSVLTVFVSTRYFPWDAIIKLPGIREISVSMQLPSRWLSFAGALLAFFSAFLFMLVKERGGGPARAVLCIAITSVILSAVYQVDVIAFESTPVFLYNEENMGTVSVVSGEYLLTGTEVTDLCYHEPAADNGLVWSGYEKEGTNVTVTLDNTTEDTCYIEIPLTGYKGYEVKSRDGVTDGEIPYISDKRGSHGDLRIAVPGKYQGTVEISYGGFLLFHVAEAVSLAAVIILLGIFLWRRLSLSYHNGVNIGGRHAKGKTR